MFVKSEPSPLDISFPVINSKFKQALVNFRLKSFLFVITLPQSKQIWSLIVTGEMHTHLIILVDQIGAGSFRHSIQGIPNVTRLKHHYSSCKSCHSSILAQNSNENPASETSQPLETLLLTQPLCGLNSG